jgi:hypothetical protein
MAANQGEAIPGIAEALDAFVIILDFCPYRSLIADRRAKRDDRAWRGKGKVACRRIRIRDLRDQLFSSASTYSRYFVKLLAKSDLRARTTPPKLMA